MRALISLSFCIWLITANLSGAAETITPKECTNDLDCAALSVVSLLPEWPANFTRNEEPEGSGIVIANGTLIATADHVLGPANAVKIRTKFGQVLSAEIVLRDALTDIAILRIDNSLQPIGINKSAATGEKACAIGNSFGLDISVTCGVISSINVSGVGFNKIEDFLQSDAAVNPGMSGGALVNKQGQLIGMLSAIFTQKSDANIGVNFAVSSNLLLKVLESYQTSGKVQHEQAGMLVRPSEPSNYKGTIGLEVIRVEDGSAEHLAGIKPGDIIFTADGRRVKRAGSYEAVRFLANDTFTVKLLRGSDIVELKVELD